MSLPVLPVLPSPPSAGFEENMPMFAKLCGFVAECSKDLGV